MQSIVKTGKSVDEAVDEALRELDCTLEDVSIEIIEEAKTGFFGLIGGRDAVVRVSRRDKSIQDLVDETAGRIEPSTPEVIREMPLHSAQVEPEIAEPEIAEPEIAEPEIAGSEVMETQPGAVPTAEQNVSVEVETSAAPDSEMREASSDQNTSKSKSINGQALIIYAENWLTQLLEQMHIKAGVKAHMDDQMLKLEIVDISDTDMGIIIGRRAETIDAIQYLLSISMNCVSEQYCRVFLDVGGYRGRRQSSIEKMARRSAEKVQRYRKPISLEPMNAYERRIVHTALQAFKNIETVSEGRDPHRYVVIRYENR